MEFAISLAFGLWICITALAYRCFCTRGSRRDK